MQSFVIASKNNDKGTEEAKSICLKKKIDQLDLTIESFEKAVGIKDIRNLTKKLFLKPFRGESKALIINSPHGLTTESQNALLKILEEPPLGTFIFLVVSDINILFPTILSRCKILKLKNTNTIDQGEVDEFKKLLENLSLKDVGFKLKLAQDFGKERGQAITWIEKAIILAREILITDIYSSDNYDKKELRGLTNLIKNLEEGRYALTNTNVNQRFILENTLLSVSH